MAIVVSDTSPIRALHLGLLALCRDLYARVILPSAVADELARPAGSLPSIDVAPFSWIEIRSPKSAPGATGVPSDLDPGETEAIALAIELRADLLLVDERKATSAARSMGLTTIGVIGVLLEAKRKELTESVMPSIDRLVNEMRFFVSHSLRERIAHLAGET